MRQSFSFSNSFNIKYYNNILYAEWTLNTRQCRGDFGEKISETFDIEKDSGYVFLKINDSKKIVF